MRQAIHIFKKDVHYLWREICLMLVLSATLGWAEIHSPFASIAEILWMLAATFIIARVIHAEAIPGHNQFWITRPYRWKSMLGEKVLFILLFVNLPMLAAHFYMVAAANFPIAASLPGLFWSELLMALCVSLPIATLAAITPGIAPFLFSAFILLAAGFLGFSGMMQPWGMNVPFSAKPIGEGPVDWVRKMFALVIWACTAGCVLYGQYRNRETRFSRMRALGGAAVALLVYLYTPWPIALDLQSRLSKRPFNGDSVGVTLDLAKGGAFPVPGRVKVTQMEVLLPIALTGIPDGLEAEPDAVAITLQGADGRTWSSGLNSVSVPKKNYGVTVIDRFLLVDPTFFASESARPVTVRGSLYMTLSGNPQARTISIEGDPVNVMDGLQCGAGMLNQVHCRSAFRWPKRRVYAQFGGAGNGGFHLVALLLTVPRGDGF